MDLVAGATGRLGSAVCRRLRAEGRAVRALVRPSSDTTRVDALRQQGVEVVVGDVRDRAVLDTACAGVESVVTTIASLGANRPGDTIDSVDRDGQIGVIEAAKAAGARHVTYASIGGELPSVIPFVAAKRAVEQHLRDSGLAHTILRPSLFMEFWLGPAVGWDVVAGRAQVFGAGENPLNFVSADDVAKMATLSLDPAASGERTGTFEVGNTEVVSALQAVAVFEEVTGRQFQVNHVPLDALKAQLGAAQDPYQASMAAMGAGIAEYPMVPTDMPDVLRRFPITLTSVRAYAERVAAGA